MIITIKVATAIVVAREVKVIIGTIEEKITLTLTLYLLVVLALVLKII